jgi:hypothetical protein
VTLVVQPTTAGPFANTATVTAAEGDPNAANNTSTATAQVQSTAVVPIPAVDAKMLMLLAALLGTAGAWIAGRIR